MTDNEILVQLLSEVKSLNGKFDRLESKVERIQTKVDHDISGLLTTVVEQHLDIVARLDMMVDYPETKGRVSDLEQVIRIHTEDIRELKQRVV